MQNGAGALFVGFRVQIGVVLGGVVGDAHDTGTFLYRQFLQRLAEIDLRRALNAVGALPEIDGVEVPLQNFFFAVVLFKFQRTENLHELPAHGDLLVIGEVFNELLGQCGAAVGAVSAHKHIGAGSQRPAPVHAVMLKKPLVLNGHRGVDHIFRNVGIGRPDTVFRRVQALKLHIISGLLVIGVDKGGLIESLILQREPRVGDNIGFQIILGFQVDHARRHRAGQHDGACQHQHDADQPPYKMDQAAGHRALGRVFYYSFLIFPFIVHSLALRC